MNPENREKKIAFAECNMNLEGFEVSEESKEKCRKILKGELKAEDVVRECLMKYKK